MSLCNTCKSIDLLSAPKLPASYNAYPMGNKYDSLVSVINRRLAEANAGQGPDEVLGIPFHQSLEELGEAATICSICKIVQHDVSAFQTAFAKDQEEQVHRKRFKGPDWKMWLAKGVNDISGFMVVSVDAESKPRAWILSAVGLCVEDDDPLSHVVSGRKIEDNASKEASVQRASNWVQHCDTEHKDPSCVAADPKMPQRVLDVNVTASDHLSIKESTGEIGKYAALSHVENTDNSTTTVNTGLELKENSVNLKSLPKIFQDAISITRKLGLQYLWIEEICITKEDHTSWSRSSPQFASIYSNAYITISATGSPNDATGMLTTRTSPTYTPFAYTNNAIQGTISAFSLLKRPTLFPRNEHILRTEPLSQHAWSLQDRLFSPRILHFGSTQMYFECNAHFLSEDGFKMTGRTDSLYSTSPSMWPNILNLYCRRTLPRSSDKLPALSNIAASLAKQTGDTYVAGLWRSHLTADLIWQATGHAAGRTSEAATYRAPSWSWASIDGPFGMFSPGYGLDTGAWVDIAKVQDLNVTLRGEDVYGEVEDAWLKLRAPLEPLNMCDEEPKAQVWKMKTARGSEEGTYCIFDTRARAERARGLELYALLLIKSQNRGGEAWTYHGVVVAGVSGKAGVYERMGKVFFDQETLGDCEWMEDETKMVDVMLV